MNKDIYDRLVEVARAGDLINYAQVAPLADLNMDMQADRNAIGVILGEISTWEHDVVAEVSGGEVLGHDSRVYELAKIESVPPGYQGYVVVASDLPITGTALPPLHNAFLLLVLRSEPEPDVRITYIVYDPPRDDVVGEYVELGNFGSHTVEMTNWTLSDTADHVYVFPTFSLAPSSGVKVWTRACTGDATNLCMGRGTAVWNNEGDTAYLRDANGNYCEQGRRRKMRNYLGYERNPSVPIYNAVVLCEVMRELDASMAETFRDALSYTQCGLLPGWALN